ncbi:MAG TPA: biopolymer transporter ExbD [Steroidobacteraceae bacterium]|nr:biopolymer transporter ExbD [Steroidobacteraceae bacterium]
MSMLGQIKRRKRHGLHGREDAELNLIPLIDILSVMVAFLLVYSTDVEVVQNTKGVEIPQSTAEAQPNQSVVVMITKEHLFVQGEVVATIAQVRDPSMPLIDPLRAVLDRPMLASSGAVVEVDIGSREITVLADKSLPYEVVRKVMATCTAADYGKISLAVLEKEAPARSVASKRA